METSKVVLITGATGGLGTALAMAYAHAGFTIVASCRDESRLRQLKEGLERETGEQCVTVLADLKNPEGLNALVQALASERVTVLVNNAGINPELRHKSPAASVHEIQEIIATNTSAAIALSIAAFEHFKTMGSGTIVNMNSAAGQRASVPEAVYSASKFGLRGFSEAVRDAWLRESVRVIDVYPGAIATGMSSARADVDTLIDPGELAKYVVGLCQTESFFVREVSMQRTKSTPPKLPKVVFANGIFDLLHPGHIELLKFAKSLGDKLIVGINSDRATKLLKGEGRPVHTEGVRKAVLENLRCVDEVVIFDDIRTGEVVGRLAPHIVVKGAECLPDVVRKVDGIPNSVEIVTFPLVLDASGHKLSTSAAIEKASGERAT